MKKCVLYVLALLPLMVCCCADEITEGEVYAKHYEPDSTDILWMPTIITNGSRMTTILVPLFVYDDEDWVLDIRAFDGQREVTRRIYVAREVYEATEIGMWLITGEYKPEQLSFSDPDVKRRATKDEQSVYHKES